MSSTGVAVATSTASAEAFNATTAKIHSFAFAGVFFTKITTKGGDVVVGNSVSTSSKLAFLTGVVLAHFL